MTVKKVWGVETNYTSGGSPFTLESIHVDRETPKFYLLKKRAGWTGYNMRVEKTSVSVTPEEALEAFTSRQELQCAVYQSQVDKCVVGVEWAAKQMGEL